MLILRLIILFACFFSAKLIYANEVLTKGIEEKCLELQNKDTIKNGWYPWEPYQFEKSLSTGNSLVGMDIELTKTIAKRIGINMEYREISWIDHQNALQTGEKDMAAGATYSEKRSKYAYFSVPYRYEENSLFMLNDSDKDLKFNNVAEFLAQIRLQNFGLGVTRGFVYADSQINLFINDESNKDIIIEYRNETDALQGLMRGEIDGFISDRVVGAARILKQENNGLVKELQLNVKTPIHLMFSKKTVPIDIVEKFNNEITNFSKSAEYKQVVKNYLYPVLIMQTIDSKWFYLIGIMGTIAFAISGIAIAAKENATLFNTFLLAMLPSVGGGIIRDVLTNREEVSIFLTPSYMYYIIIVVLVGFSVVRLLEYYNQRAEEDSSVNKFWDKILILGDASGQAAFIVTGVSIAIMAKINPIELWGPFFAFLTASGGTIFRDLIRKKRTITCLSGTFNAEIGVIWGLVFSIYLNLNADDPSADGIRNMVIIVVGGCFATRMLALYFNIPNIRFRQDLPKKLVEKEIVADSKAANAEDLDVK